MATIVELREPLKSWVGALDGFRIHAVGHQIRQDDSMFSALRLPALDPEDAKQLADELQAAVGPIITRFRNRKINELTGGQADTVVRI